MRRIMRHNGFLTLAVLLAAFATAAYGETISDTVIGVGTVPSPINVGDTFSVDVVLFSINTPPISVYGFDMEVLFPSFLTAESATEEGFFAANGLAGFSSNYMIDNTNDDITGLFDAAAAPDINSPALIDVLFSVQFQANAVGTGNISIACDNGNDCADFPLLADNNFNSIPVDSLNSGSVSVTTPEPVAALSLGGGMLLLLLGRRRLKRQL
jgi:hypothetical protein